MPNSTKSTKTLVLNLKILKQPSSDQPRFQNLWELWFTPLKGKIVCTGDFKFDFTPVGEPADLHRMTALRRRRSLSAQTQPTRKFQPYQLWKSGWPIHHDHRRGSTGCIILASFASVIFHLQQAAEAVGRPVADRLNAWWKAIVWIEFTHQGPCWNHYRAKWDQRLCTIDLDHVYRKLCFNAAPLSDCQRNGTAKCTQKLGSSLSPIPGNTTR